MGMLDFMLNEGKGLGMNPTPAPKVPILPQTPAGMADVAAASRALRVAQYGETAVAAMEAAGSKFGGAVQVPPAAPAAGRFATAMPTFARGIGALGGMIPGIGTGLAVAGEGVGVANSAMDPNATRIDVATRAAEGMGRLGAMGAGAGVGGIVGGPVGAAIGGVGGYFAPNLIYAARDLMRGPDAAPAAPVASATPAAAPRAFQADVRRVDNAIAGTQAADPFTPRLTSMSAADIRGTGVPVSGTGAMVNNRTGQVTQFDNRGDPGFGVAPQMVDASTYDAMRGAAPRRADFGMPDRTPIDSPIGRTWAGNMVGAKLNMGRAASDARQAAGYTKLGADIALRRDATAATREGQAITAQTARERTAAESVGKGAMAAKTTAEALSIMEQQRLAMAEPDPVKRVALLKGYNPPSDTNVFLPTMDPNKIDVGNRASGAVRRVTPMQPVTSANIDAALAGSMKGKSRAQVIQAYKDKGYDVSGVK